METKKVSDFKNEITFMTETLSTMVNKMPLLGLMQGKMGYSIFFYHASKFANNLQYVNVADKLLDSVCKEVNERYPSDITNGLAGIGLGINHLIREGYVEGNINNVLEKIDIPIFKAISFQENKLPIDFRLKIQLLYYCYIRLKEQKDKSNGNFIFENIIFKILNSFIQYPNDLWEEPYSFSLYYPLSFFLYILGLLSTINIFRDKIRKIIDEITPYVISKIPVLHAYRLYLIFGMLSSAKEFNLLSWQKHIQLLKHEINIPYMLNNEFKDKNIFLENGISGILYLLLMYNDSVCDDEKIRYDIDLFIDKITSSATWIQLKNDIDFFRMNSGLNGFCGTALIINLINR
jgi:hypothetical protein